MINQEPKPQPAKAAYVKVEQPEPLPEQPELSEDAKLRWEIANTRDNPFFIDTVRPLLNEYDEEKISFSRFVEVLNVTAYKWRQQSAGEVEELREQVKKLREEMLPAGWISVDDRPLFTKDDKGNWVCTEDGSSEFIAAVPYTDSKRPNETNLWWIRHCVVEDAIGLCVVGDDDNEPAGWQIEDVVYWMPWPAPPTPKQLLAETDKK